MLQINPNLRRGLMLLSLAPLTLCAASSAHAFTYDVNAPRPNEVTIKSTNYPIPAVSSTVGVLYVAPEPTGNAANPGTSPGAPTTVNDALNTINASTTKRYTVVFAGGTYRQVRGRGIGNPATLQAATGAQPWLTGADIVTNWVDTTPTDGNVGPKWSTSTLPSGTSSSYKYEWPSKGIGDPRIVDPSKNDMADDHEQVFVDSEPKVQVSTLGAVGAGTFFVDRGANKIIIGVNPAGKSIAVTSAEFGLGLGGGVIVRGLGFRQYAFNGIQTYQTGNTVENCSLTWNGDVGFLISASDNTARGNAVISNARVGLDSQGGGIKSGLLVEGNRIAYNNVEGFNEAWSSGGAKSGRLRGTTWRDNWVDNNFGKGLWFDNSCIDDNIYRNVITNNGIGGMYEISHGGRFAFNLAIGNDVGILIDGSSDCQIYNNTLVDNKVNITVKDAGRHNDLTKDGGRCGGGGAYDGDGYECGEDADEAALGSTWVATGNVVRNNILTATGANSPKALLDADGNNDNPGVTPGLKINQSVPYILENSSLMFASLDFNVYQRTSSGTPGTAINWFENGAARNSATVAGFRTTLSGLGKTYETNAVANLDNQSNPLFNDAAANDFRIKQSAPYTVRSRGNASVINTAYYTARTAGVTNPWPGAVAAEAAQGAAPLAGAGTYRGAFQPVPGTPNLVVDFINWSSANPQSGDALVLSAVIRNAGNAPTPDNTIHGLIFNVDGSLASYIGDGYTDSLLPGQTLNVTSGGGNGPAWTAIRGQHTISAIVDNGTLIAESNEADNTRNATINVDAVPVTAINAGEDAVTYAPFQTDRSFNGGLTFSTTNTVTTTGAANPAPAQVYQSERYGNGAGFSYTIGGLTSGTSYLVRLHFAETLLTGSGTRIFSVNINGGTVELPNFDIWSAAGDQNKAVTREFNATANPSGQIVIDFIPGSVQNPKVNGLEILR